MDQQHQLPWEPVRNAGSRPTESGSDLPAPQVTDILHKYANTVCTYPSLPQGQKDTGLYFLLLSTQVFLLPFEALSHCSQLSSPSDIPVPSNPCCCHGEIGRASLQTEGAHVLVCPMNCSECDTHYIQAEPLKVIIWLSLASPGITGTACPKEGSPLGTAPEKTPEQSHSQERDVSQKEWSA